MRYPGLISLLVASALMCPDAANARDNTDNLKKGTGAPAVSAVVYSIRVDIDPAAGVMEAEARIELPERTKGSRKSGKWLVHVQGLEVTSATLDGKAIKIKDGHIKAKRGSLLVRYKASGANLIGYDPSNPGVVAGNLISKEGISLTSGWYPEVEDVSLAYFSLKAVLPQGYEAVSEAEEITVIADESGVEFSFLFPYPVGGITLAAGPYKVFRAEVNGIQVYGYFLPDDVDMAEEYVRESVKYIELYTALIGKFPYTRFSVVENILPTGYSMPTYTLLGREVMRLPFILSTSLGHEVLHQWFGAGVYVDPAGGNWSEGLVAYLADYYYDELKGKGEGHRKKLMLDYKNYVHADKDAPLADFRVRADRATRSIGYGKGAMVFHMLRRELGDEAFFKALGDLASGKRFKSASWDDIRVSAEKESGRKLGWFFSQWVNRPGHIRMQINQTTYLYLRGRHIVRFVLEQKGKPYRFRLPVYVSSGAGATAAELVEVDGAKTVVEIETPGIPLELQIDPGYELMRNLSIHETPAVWATVMGASRKVVVVPADEAEAEIYSPLLEALGALGFEAVSEDNAGLGLLRSSALVVPGATSALLERLYGRDEYSRHEDSPEGFFLNVYKNPFMTRLAVAQVYASSAKEARLAARKLSHYGKYSNLRFAAGLNIDKSVSPSQDGIRHSFDSSVAIVRTDNTIRLDDVIDEIEGRDVIFVGESHNRFGDHKLQLSVIRALVERGHKVAVGMEMFEPKGQVALDEFVAGRISEREFMMQSQYYDSWGMNYHLYREILDYAREQGLPVLGLNQKESIVKKVSRNGLGSLSKEELGQIPAEMDMSDQEYRTRLRGVFYSHGASPSRDFTSFYQAQVLRDEAMAHGIARFMSNSPGYKVVVVVGQGHVAYGSGIPRRLKRINGSSYSILVNADSGSVDPEMADYVFYAPAAAAPKTPLLGVSLKKAEGGLSVAAVQNGSLAEGAGIKKGDLIVAVGEEKVASVPELKVILFQFDTGQTIKISVLRKRTLFRPKEMEFSIKLP